ncbi:MAG: Translation initiation factor IF-2 [Lentisphaerae bacterium ADurb.BinA184]|nr:MAG: Translation initiation factor IF-2 [Lentisphaerae bacterium ADurb.BinA184]
MSEKVRVYELARELGLTNKELIALLQREGVAVASHSSSIDGDTATLVRDQVIAARKQSTPPKATDVVAALKAAAQAQQQEEVKPQPATVVGESGRPEIHIKPPIIVRDLAKALNVKPNELIGELMTMNVFASINQVVEPDIVEKVCVRRGFEFVRERRERPAKGPRRLGEEAMAPGAAGKRPVTGHVPRPPVVGVLGHVDHGKTSLLDAIRETRVAAGETGGITQHIGASVVEWHGHTITFLDTPGHAAFTAMRARGANATDIVVLVVAANDGVMPQTIEAINHATAAGCKIVVALNKIDLPEANPDRALLQLQQNGVMPEQWGGEVGVVPVSATTKQGVEDLLERILLEAEVMGLRSNPSLPADGLVIEAQLEPGMGPTASVLIRNGTLRTGDILLCGQHYGRVKALIDSRGQRLKSAGPSTPVKVLGLSGVPEAGEAVVVLEDEREAKARAEARAQAQREGELTAPQKASLEDLFRQITEESKATLRLILKTDVRGSLEAIADSLAKIQSEKITLDILHRGVGEVTDNDVLLAAASNAIIAGFRVRAMPGVNKTAKQRGVEIRLYGIIYELLDDIEDAMRGRLKPETREQVIGHAEILRIFEVSKAGRICGCVVKDGAARIGASARVMRQGGVIYNGLIQSLKHFKDDVREMRAGQECGIRLDNFEDFEVGDLIEVFTIEQVAPEL